MPFWAVAAPILAQVAQNVLSGINTRKARLYDSPKEQVKRFQEAGLPMASTSRITTGGGFTTAANIQDPSPSIQANLGASLKREIDRKQINLLAEGIKEKGAQAAIATGQAKNILNPAGVFENTNQGTQTKQSIQAINADIAAKKLTNDILKINKTYLPTEKAIGILKSQSDFNEQATRIANNLIQNKILVSDAQIKKIVAMWQPKMSKAEYDNLVSRTTGQNTSNAINEIQREIADTGKEAAISMNQWRSTITSEELKRSLYTNEQLQKMNSSYDRWFEMKRKVDEATKNKMLWSPADIQAFLYTLIYAPTPSSGNVSPISTAAQFIPK